MSQPVMIVDDDPAIRGVVVSVLRKEGYDVRAVESGEGSLQQVRQGFRGVILMDIVMEGMDGWDAIRAMQAEGLAVGNAICMLTGIRTPTEKAAGLEELVMDYLTKPFAPGDLVRMVKTAEECLSEGL